jgi:hypothetical protein
MTISASGLIWIIELAAACGVDRRTFVDAQVFTQEAKKSGGRRSDRVGAEAPERSSNQASFYRARGTEGMDR